jgi:isopentenyl-diphosphate delta-isomerase
MDMKNGLWEHEFDHVLIGHYDGPVKPNPEEAMAVQWEDPRHLITQFKSHPEKYTVWMMEALERAVAYHETHAKSK